MLSSESEIEVGNVDSFAAWGGGESRVQVAAAEAAKRPHLGVKSPLHSPAQVGSLMKKYNITNVGVRNSDCQKGESFSFVCRC